MRAKISSLLDRYFPDAARSLVSSHPSPLIERLALALESHPLLGQQLRGAKGIVADLDYTLVDSKPAFRTLNYEVAVRLGVRELEHVAAMDECMRGQPLEAYLAAFHAVCQTHGESSCSLSELLQVQQAVIEDMASGRRPIPGGLDQIPDSFLLVTVLTDFWQKPLRVCTHCPRQLAIAFVRESGFGALINPNNMVCGDDTDLAKSSPEYWEHVLPVDASGNWIGLDDTADGASWMLRVAGLGLVIVRPSAERYFEPLIALKEEFGDRLCILKEFGELFAIGRGEV